MMQQEEPNQKGFPDPRVAKTLQPRRGKKVTLKQQLELDKTSAPVAAVASALESEDGSGRGKLKTGVPPSLTPVSVRSPIRPVHSSPRLQTETEAGAAASATEPAFSNLSAVAEETEDLLAEVTNATSVEESDGASNASLSQYEPEDIWVEGGGPVAPPGTKSGAPSGMWKYRGMPGLNWACSLANVDTWSSGLIFTTGEAFPTWPP